MIAVSDNSKKWISELEQIKNTFQRENTFPPKTMKYWSVAKRKYKGELHIEIRKNLAIYEQRLSKYGVILRRIVTGVSSRWFILSADPNNGKIQIYCYFLDLQNSDPNEHSVYRKPVALISTHAIERMMQRKFSSLSDALYTASISTINEIVRLAILRSSKNLKVTSYSEKTISSICSGALCIGFYPEDDNHPHRANIIIKTYISPDMMKKHNIRSCQENYYHEDKVEPLVISDSLRNSLKGHEKRNKIPEDLILKKGELDITCNKDDFKTRLQKGRGNTKLKVGI